MITGPSQLAVESGVQTFKNGGNIVDAAVSTALVLAVTSPYFAALGGGGFALVHIDSQSEVLDFREHAPAKTHPQYYIQAASPKASRLGGKAIGVPGIPYGLWELHRKYGKLKWHKLFNSALKYSKKGFRVSGEWYKHTSKNIEKMSPASKKHLLISQAALPKPGQIQTQKALFKALKLFRKKGPKAFYEGRVAEDLVSSISAAGGEMSLEDLKNYRPKWRKPLYENFAGYKLMLMPPPSSGGLVIGAALNLTQRLQLKKTEARSLNEYHLLAEIMKQSFSKRHLLGDPAFHINPISEFTSDDSRKKFLKKISSTKAFIVPSSMPIPQESPETTHFSVMDSKGNALAMTLTLNGNYGSKVISKKYGIALNNQMDDFTTRPGQPNMFGLIQGKGNEVQAGKRPLSSMSPTLVLKNNKAVMSLGAPGGPRIINGVFQVLYRTLVQDLNMDEAIQQPRIHHQYLPNVLFYEKNKFTPETLNSLMKKGHKLKEIHGVAIVNGIRLNKKEFLEGAFDHRGEGYVSGY